MNTELKPGMMALVIGANRVSSNIGKIVTLDRFVSSGDFAICGETIRDLWIVNGDSVGYSSGGKIIIGSIGLCRPEHLMAIKPESDPLHTKEEQHASA